MSKKLRRIDVHHHITPAFYVNALKNSGLKKSYGQPFPDWTPGTSLAFMNRTGIDKAYMSICIPGVCFRDAALSKTLTRMCNDYMGRVKNLYSGKFGAFASLPMLCPDAALTELCHALDRLQLDGVIIMSNYDGKYPGHDNFKEIFHELNKRKTVVFIHPCNAGIYNAHGEATFETSRAIANLIYTGTLERYPDITWILSHDEGTIPYIGWRLAMSGNTRKNKRVREGHPLYNFLVKNDPKKGLALLSKLYYDTANAGAIYACEAIQKFVHPSHIVFGTNFPTTEINMASTENPRRSGGFPGMDQHDINYANCHSIFAQGI